jgi:tRNA nucleotidyltransferase/poly(A) polymerase
LNFDTKAWLAQLPDFFLEVLQELTQRGLTATLVGGSVRDYFLQGKLGKDWDLELTHESVPFSKDFWKDLGKGLGRFGRTSFLPYEIIRLEHKGYQLEFSPPRQEIFEPHLKHQGHKNFVATFDFKLPFEQAVKRRDFTINAMGVRFHSGSRVELLDPLQGLLHLRDKLLHPCGSDFAQDPVRFLRAIRFAHLLNFGMSDELEQLLKGMDLSGISASYLWSEMQKSRDPLGFYGELLEWAIEHPELKLPTGQDALGKLPELKQILTAPDKHEAWMVGLEWVGLEASAWQKFFNLSSESARRLAQWASSSKAFAHIMPEKFHGEFLAVIEQAQFEQLFNWYFTTRHLLQKNPQLPILSMIEEFLPYWIHLYRFEPLKDVKHIDPPLRAKYQVWNLCQRI